MNRNAKWLFIALVGTMLVVGGSQAFAQWGAPSNAGMQAMYPPPQGGMPMYAAPAGGQAPLPLAMAGSKAAGDCDSCAGDVPRACGACRGRGCGACGYRNFGSDGACTACAGGDCTSCLGVMNVHGPYCTTGCCTPRWFDLQFDGVYLQRKDIGASMDFTSNGIAGAAILSTNHLEFEERPGLRATIALLTTPSSNLEVSYLGTLYWQDSAQVTGANSLFSVFSAFGTDPNAAASVDGIAGYTDTDAADLHRIDYSSKLDSVEMNWRRRFITAGCRVHCSYMVGVRYLRLDEEFRHITEVDVPAAAAPARNGGIDYMTTTQNDLIGPQLGGDAYFCVFPGLMVGGDAKAGIFGNSGVQSSRFAADSITTLNERTTRQDVSFIGEANLTVLARINDHLTLRGGYQVLFIDGVALASENFNATPPGDFLPTPAATRTVVLNQNGDAFYHGLTAGVEWIW